MDISYTAEVLWHQFDELAQSRGQVEEVSKSQLWKEPVMAVSWLTSLLVHPRQRPSQMPDDFLAGRL